MTMAPLVLSRRKSSSSSSSRPGTTAGMMAHTSNNNASTARAARVLSSSCVFVVLALLVLQQQLVAVDAFLNTAQHSRSSAPATSIIRGHHQHQQQQTQRRTAITTTSVKASMTVNGDASTTATTANGATQPNGSAAAASDNNSNFQKDIRLNVPEKARTVTSVCTSGTLCTLSSHEGIEGAPFGSFVDYVLDDAGNPVFLMNEMSMHTINIRKARELQQQQDAAAPTLVSLFTQLGGGQTTASRDTDSSSKKTLQDVSRCSLTGTLEKMDPATCPDMDAIRMRYSIAHTYADQVMDSPKFAFYRLVPSKIYFVGGFGVLAKWVDVGDYQTAAPDILASEAATILERINNSEEYASDLQLTAQQLLDVQTDIERIRVTNVDRLGMDIRVTSQMQNRRNKLQTDEFRVGFRIPVISVEDAKSEILKIFQEAWEKGNGYDWTATTDAEVAIPIMKIAADSLE